MLIGGVECDLLLCSLLASLALADRSVGLDGSYWVVCSGDSASRLLPHGRIMQEVVADVNNIVFDIEIAMDQQLGVQPLPFTGMDSKSMQSVVSFHCAC